MRKPIQLIFLIFGLCFCFKSEAKKCTETTIRNALKSKKKFDFNAENCSDDVVYVSQGIRLSGNMLVDGRNKLRLSWRGEGAQCDEKPRSVKYATFYTTGNNNTLKNFTILKSPEGIHLSTGKNNVVDNVTFERICEDAITNGNKRSSSATGSIIRNSRFFNGPDKAIQCNGGELTVQNSEFRDIPRSIGACTYKADPGNHVAKECPQPCHIKAYNNRVYGCRAYAFRGAGYLQGKKQGSLTAVGNYFESCETPLMASQYGYIYAEENTTQGRCDEFANTEEHGRGDICSNNISSCRREYRGNIQRRCLAQDPAPPNTEPPRNDPREEAIVYTAEGTGSTTLSLSPRQQEKLACSRAKDKALVNARAQCVSPGKIISQETTGCEGQCRPLGRGMECVAKASVWCQHDEPVSRPTPPAPEEPEPEPPSSPTLPFPSEPTPPPSPEPEPEPEEPKPFPDIGDWPFPFPFPFQQ